MRKRQEDQDLLPEVTAMWNQRAKRGIPQLFGNSPA